jgi:hypothetical protein
VQGYGLVRRWPRRKLADVKLRAADMTMADSAGLSRRHGNATDIGGAGGSGLAHCFLPA